MVRRVSESACVWDATAVFCAMAVDLERGRWIATVVQKTVVARRSIPGRRGVRAPEGRGVSAGERCMRRVPRWACLWDAKAVFCTMVVDVELGR